MTTPKNFEELSLHLCSRGGSRRRVAIVWAIDNTTREAAAMALEAGFAEVIFSGCRREVMNDDRLAPFADLIRIVDAEDPDEAARKAVALVRNGEADILMKGMINSDNYLRAILNKEDGIVEHGSVLAHLTVAEIPAYPKLLMLSDVAVIPYPTAEQFSAMVGYMAAFGKKMGIPEPKIALTHCSEKVDPRHFPFTESYVDIIGRSRDGAYGPCIVDGPMDVKTACSLKALEKKGMTSPLMGESDGIIFPDIEAGNTFYKTVTLFAGATVAGIVMGAKVPVVLPSRGDNALSKFNSLVLASL